MSAHSPLQRNASGSGTPNPSQGNDLAAELLENIQTVPAKLWKKGSVIGHGGVKGSIVFRSAVAYKVAPQGINTSELYLIRELQDNTVPGLVTPFLVTLSETGSIDGVVMPCLTCSLQELLVQLPPPHKIPATVPATPMSSYNGSAGNSGFSGSGLGREGSAVSAGGTWDGHSTAASNNNSLASPPAVAGANISSNNSNGAAEGAAFISNTISSSSSNQQQHGPLGTRAESLDDLNGGMGGTERTCSMTGAVSNVILGGTEGAVLTETSQEDGSILHRVPTFRPIDSLKVLGCITYQILVGLKGLKYDLPHSVNDTEYTGFSHNDLRLDNVLVDANTGAVLLCDFEQVNHYRKSDGMSCSLCNKPRQLSNAYIPAKGASLRSDEWCLGLLVLELFTGVQPLLDSLALQDDFTYAPEALELGFDWDRRCEADPDNFPSLRDWVHKKMRRMPFLARYRSSLPQPKAAPRSAESTPTRSSAEISSKDSIASNGNGTTPGPVPIHQLEEAMKDVAVTTAATATATTVPAASTPTVRTTNHYGLTGTSVSSTYSASPTGTDGGRNEPATPAAFHLAKSERDHYHNNVAFGEAFDDFMSRTLNRDPAERWDVSQLLEHRWMKMSTRSNTTTMTSGPSLATPPAVAEDTVRRWLHLHYRPGDLMPPRTPADSNPRLQ